jgi:hypothetical protein
MRFGNTVLSQQGGCPSGGGKAPKNVFILKIRVISDIFSGENIDWWSLLSNHQNEIAFTGFSSIVSSMPLFFRDFFRKKRIGL